MTAARCVAVLALVACALGLGVGSWSVWRVPGDGAAATLPTSGEPLESSSRSPRSPRAPPVPTPARSAAPAASGSDADEANEDDPAVWRARMRQAHDTVERWLAEAGTGELVELECDDLPCVAVLLDAEGTDIHAAGGPLMDVVIRNTSVFSKVSLTFVTSPVGSGPPDVPPPPSGRVYVIAAVGKEPSDSLGERISAMSDAASSYEQQSFEDRMIARGYYVRDPRTPPAE